MVSAAVDEWGTPCYVTRALPITLAVEMLESGARGPVRAWLSVKTHPLKALLTWWALRGGGVEVVSEAELAAGLRCGCPTDQLLVNGVAKQHWLWRFPKPGLRVHFDSLAEMEALLPLALRHGWRVGVRLHAPTECDAREPAFGGQFGMTPEEGVTALRRLTAAGAIAESVHFHVGQRQAMPDAWLQGVLRAADVCLAAGFRPRFVDLGGGLPDYPAPDALAHLRQAIDAAWRTWPDLKEVWVEHGRFVLEHASVLAVRVLDSKVRPECRYLICDGGRTNHALAADKGRHALFTVPSRSGPPRLTTLCGPTCMTDDTFGRFDLPADVSVGDVLVWMNAGAYHLPWETRFSHGLCAVAWCDEHEQVSLARRRERPHEWMA